EGDRVRVGRAVLAREVPDLLADHPDLVRLRAQPADERLRVHRRPVLRGAAARAAVVACRRMRSLAMAAGCYGSRQTAARRPGPVRARWWTLARTCADTRERPAA